MEIDDEDKYRQKMKGIYNYGNSKKSEKSMTLPKIRENITKKNIKKEKIKTNSILTYNKKEKESKPVVKKIHIGKQIWIKDMVEKEKEDTPKRDRIVYESEEDESEENGVEEEEKEEEKKDNNLPPIESKGMALFSRNTKLESKNYDN